MAPPSHTTPLTPTTIAPSPAPTPRLYFAYASNLSPTQMLARCPLSPLSPTPLARLPGHRWHITPRGYASIRPSPTPGAAVHGLLYHLTPADEEELDCGEGVPWAYAKHLLDVEIHDGGAEVRVVSALVYIDPRVGPGTPSAEYVARLEAGRAESAALGLELGESWGEGWREGRGLL